MPWCPKCRDEYVEGVTVCADCGVALVDELPEDTPPDAPAVLCEVADRETGEKFVTYLEYGGIQTAGLIEVEDGSGKFSLVVAEFERAAAEQLFARFDSVDTIAQMNPDELIPELEMKLEELESEEASQMFSELRTEASSVYVKKKDKYSDFLFSGISFLIFGVIGFTIIALNWFDVISWLNPFSMLIMAIVFVIFFAVGISSLIRARKLKGIVNEEEQVTEQVTEWIRANITDERISGMFDPGQTQEDNYFEIHGRLCEIVSEQFPFYSRDFIDQLMDDRYNQFCENMEPDGTGESQNTEDGEESEE